MTIATLKTVIGETVKIEFEDADTPRDVLRSACRDDIEMMVPFFGTVEKARAFADTGALNIQTSQFSLVNGAEKAVSFDFDIPILEQIPGDMKIGSNDSLTFLVTADTVVGGFIDRMQAEARAKNAGTAPARMTNEMKAYRAFANAVSGYFGGNVGVTARQSGSDIEIVVRNFPVYGSSVKRNVILRLPGGLLVATSTYVKFRSPLGSGSVRILLDNGKAFPHSHVWDDGTPCWNNNSITNLAQLFTTFVNTLTWMNISKDSRTYGHFTDCECTRTLMRKPDIWTEISGQRRAVSRVAGFDVGSKDPLTYFGSSYGGLLAASMR